MTKKETYQFKVGDRVASAVCDYYEDEYSGSKEVPLYYDPDGDDLSFGVVDDITAKGKVMVMWDEYYGSEPQQAEAVDPDKLLPEKVAEELYSKLEKEYNLIQKELKVKMKEVAKGIAEADKLARKTGRPLAQMDYDVIYSILYPAMDKAGWRTSSFGC